MKQTLFILLMGCSLIQLHAQEEYRYFPTGMKWKEVLAEPFSSLPVNGIDRIYQIIILNVPVLLRTKKGLFYD